MLKRLGKVFLAASIFLGAQNDHLNIEEEEITIVPVVEQLDYVEDNDDEDDEERKGYIKSVFYYIPTLLYSLLCFVFNIIKGLFMLDPIAFIVIALLLLAAILLHHKKYWGIIFGILAGLLMIYEGHQTVEEILDGRYIGAVIIVYHIVLGIVIYRKAKQVKKKIKDPFAILEQDTFKV
ncbi:MAG: hypothetical protein E7191_04425 [Erysipelotrichaceae bacterium]|nr:hypothetical protein [Erysipelotrichaceae bacterium]